MPGPGSESDSSHTDASALGSVYTADTGSANRASGVPSAFSASGSEPAGTRSGAGTETASATAQSGADSNVESAANEPKWKLESRKLYKAMASMAGQTATYEEAVLTDLPVRPLLTPAEEEAARRATSTVENAKRMLEEGGATSRPSSPFDPSRHVIVRS